MLRYPDLLERSFVCFSFGKVYNCTGWKLGYCITSSHLLMEEFRKVHQFNCFSCHSPSQVALSAFLKTKDSYLSLPWVHAGKKGLFSAADATNKVYDIAQAMAAIFNVILTKR